MMMGEAVRPHPSSRNSPSRRPHPFQAASRVPRRWLRPSMGAAMRESAAPCGAPLRESRRSAHRSRMNPHLTLPIISASVVHAALEWHALVAALADAFRAGANAPARWNQPVDDAGNRLLLMPAWDARAIGVKVVTVFPENSARDLPTVAALYLLLDAATGCPVALIDGDALTVRRTAATSALASTYLSRPDARVLAVIGTGHLAPYMALAHCAVRSIDRVLVWGRAAGRAEATAAWLREQGLPAERGQDLATVLGEADIVTCATTAQHPIVRGALVRPGTHVDLVGAFTPAMRESDDELI